MDTEGLSIICAGIGCPEENENGALVGYTKGEYCLDSLKDLQRFLRRDNPQRRDVFKQICKWNIVSRDLVPLIEHYQSDRNLLISAVKILVFMTMPVDHSSDNVAQQIEYLWDLKASLTRSISIAVIVSLLEDPLDHLEHNTFAEDDWKLVQLVLTLFRNILAIHDITQQQKSAGLATQCFCLADRLLELMFEENVMDLIIVLTQHVDDSSGYFQQDNLLLLEIFNCIFLGQDPELIARVSKQADKVNEDISTTIDSLRYIMEEEKEKRRTIHLRNVERHSQFSGTFTLLGVDGSKTVLKRHPTSVSGNGVIKIHNVQRGPLKRIAWDHDNLHPGKKNILELLNEFLSQFLSGGYNVLMQSIYADITKESLSIQKAEIMMFFRVTKFVLAFQHQKILISKESNMEEPHSDLSCDNLCGDKATFHGEVCEPVAATMNEAMLNFVISKWLETFDGLKQTNDYKSLSTIGSLFKSMIRMLDLVLKVSFEGSKETQVTRVLLYKVFYDQTDEGLTHFLLNMFKSFNSHKQPKSDLADLLEVIHVMFRLMEKLQDRGALRVARKSRKGRRKEKPKGGNNEPASISEHMNVKTDVDQADETGGHSSETLVEPNSLINKQSTKFSDIDQDIDQEVMPPSDQAADVAINKRSIGDGMVPLVGEIENADVIELAHEPVDSSSDDQLPDTNEVDFNITKLVATFVNNCVVSNLCWLLKYYKSNSAGTNHYIICMLRRICDDLDISPMLYQLSILRVFYDILADQESSKSKKHSNIVNFITKFIRKMLKLMKERPLLFVEILFWKTRRECHCITADALLASVSDLQKDANKPHDGTFLRTGTRPKSIADSLGDDEFILPSDFNNLRDDDSSDELYENSFDQTKKNVGEASMRSISNDNLEMDRRSKNIKVPKPYKGFIDQEQENTIRNLYDKYKGDKRCSHLIAEALNPEGNITPVQVNRKLKQLGLHTLKKKKLSGVNAFITAGEDPTEEAKEKKSYQGAALRKRKRVQTFSKDQELKIKILFERFKHHKKCSHMIAEALDADKTYSAIQITRKLKQLGLVAPKKIGSSETINQARDEDNGSDEEKETLLSIKQRSLTKKSKLSTNEETTHESGSLLHKVTPDGQDSDEETLASLLKNRVPRQLEEALEDPVSIDQNLEDEMDTGTIPSALDDDDDDVVMKNNLSDEVWEREIEPNYDDSEEEMHTFPASQKAGHKRNLKLVFDEEDDY
ncbi:protein timeless homolog [Zingiber officinale]|uniref:protein timeless homolog n=1 Tax=Zingiber officinale TaxID=94328 RepID=UPI001C4ADB36|nr:protein timeless homolog [Zingiber officinale]